MMSKCQVSQAVCILYLAISGFIVADCARIQKKGKMSKLEPSSLKHEKHADAAAKEKDPRFTEAETATMVKALEFEFMTAHETIKKIPFNEKENPAFPTQNEKPAFPTQTGGEGGPQTIKYLTEWQLCLANAVVVAGTNATMRCLETAKAATAEQPNDFFVPTDAEMGPCCTPNSRSALGEAASRGAQTYDGNEMEPNLASKAVLTGFPITLNEAFADGNKRTGMLVTELFLKENGYGLTDRAAFWTVSSACADEEADEWCICEVEKYLEGGTCAVTANGVNDDCAGATTATDCTAATTSGGASTAANDCVYTANTQPPLPDRITKTYENGMIEGTGQCAE